MSTGADVIAEALIQLGVTHVFGIVGIPVIEVAEACITNGIKFISFRNEQACTYAATAYGYLTGKPGVCLVVGGPGLVHALAGAENSKANGCFPLLLLAGSSESFQREKGAFQELNQIHTIKEFTKFTGQPVSIKQVPFLLEKAYRTAYFGRPGCSYVDLPADIIQWKTSTDSTQIESILPPGDAPRSMSDPERIARAIQVLRTAKAPLLIVGKGAAYSRAEKSIRKLVELINIPFLPTPMGKGVVPDDNELNVSAARSAALKSADVIILLGARLNWILHYGDYPKFNKNVQIIQVDISPEELGNNAGSSHLGIVGDVDLVTKQLIEFMPKNFKCPTNPSITQIKGRNIERATVAETSDRFPIAYQQVYKTIRDTFAESVPKGTNIVYVSEGANTMDTSRSSFPLNNPRTRLDAGTNATMGVGLGYAIAAKVTQPNDLVVAIEGDSAFGFSAIEVETAVRSNLPMIIYVMNNSGVYHGVDPSLYDQVDEKPLPSTALQLNTKYHDLAISLGAEGYLASTLDEVKNATESAIKNNKVAVINVIIDSGKDKKLEFGWMASTKPKL